MGKDNYKALHEDHDAHSEGDTHETILSASAEEMSAYEIGEDSWASSFKMKINKCTLDGAIVASFRLMAGRDLGCHNCIGFGLTIVLQLFTACVQLTIVTIFEMTTADLVWQNFEVERRDLWISIIDKALRNHSTVNLTDPLETRAAAICVMQHAGPGVGYMMLFLWLALMMKHVWDGCQRLVMVAMWPSTKPKDEEKEGKKKDDKGGAKKKKPDYDHMKEAMGKEKDKVDHMNAQWKFFIIVFVLLPHLALAGIVTYVGVGFLVMTGDPGSLILRAMALKLVMLFDKVFYGAFVSAQFHAYLSKAKFVIQKPKARNYWHSWLASLVKLSAAVITTIAVWSNYDWLLKFRRLCKTYMEEYGETCLGETCGMQVDNVLMDKLGILAG
jgi:hypothetical protein